MLGYQFLPGALQPNPGLDRLGALPAVTDGQVASQFRGLEALIRARAQLQSPPVTPQTPWTQLQSYPPPQPTPWVQLNVPRPTPLPTGFPLSSPQAQRTNQSLSVILSRLQGLRGTPGLGRGDVGRIPQFRPLQTTRVGR